MNPEQFYPLRRRIAELQNLLRGKLSEPDRVSVLHQLIDAQTKLRKEIAK